VKFVGAGPGGFAALICALSGAVAPRRIKQNQGKSRNEKKLAGSGGQKSDQIQVNRTQSRENGFLGKGVIFGFCGNRGSECRRRLPLRPERAIGEGNPPFLHPRPVLFLSLTEQRQHREQEKEKEQGSPPPCLASVSGLYLAPIFT
jgi:hypothetical protein